MHLLFVEDNPDLLANLCDYFEESGHTVDVAYDAGGGLKLASQGAFDAIILDRMLPGMDGAELCSRLRAEGSDTPILMLTARDTLENKLEGFEAGADDYLVKPFALPELAARVTALVRRSRGEHVGKTWRIVDLEYDTDRHRARRGERLLELPPIPLRILVLLMRRSPAVVRRAEIEREIWGDAPPDSDALRAHMHTLRTAVDRGARVPLLHTVRGVGYRLGEEDDDQ